MIPQRKVTNITRYVETEAPIIELGELISILRLAFGASFQDFTYLVQLGAIDGAHHKGRQRHRLMPAT